MDGSGSVLDAGLLGRASASTLVATDLYAHHMAAAPSSDPWIDGSARLQRVGRWRFPVDELMHGTESLARLGRDGSMRIFFGPGRRVVLATGTEWRIKSNTSGRFITPLVVSGTGKVAVSGPLYAKQSYGINGSDYGINVIPQDRVGLRRPRMWALRQHETDVAHLDYVERWVETSEPVRLSAVLLAFTLITHGIPGEARLTPSED